MLKFQNNYDYSFPHDGESLIKKIRFISNDGKVTYPFELRNLGNIIVDNFTPPQNCKFETIFGLVDHPYFFETTDVIKFAPDIVRTNDVVCVNCNYCDKYGNISNKPVRFEDEHVGKYLVKIVYMYSTSVCPSKKRKNTFDRDDDYKR